MSDLRELLGANHDETIETAARALDAAWNPERYPPSATQPLTEPHNTEGA